MQSTVAERFKVRTEAGEVMELTEWQEWIDAGSFDDPHARLPGMKRIVDEEGQAVNYIDDDHYHLVQRGVDAVRLR